MGTITVANLGKSYRQYASRWSRLAEWVVPFGGPRHTLKTVLQDINFTVEPGEAVGIIGINGAGKTTLLKMITGTTQPTTGTVRTSGRIAALLELGMGFHPDFTGRQNVHMAGQLLGHSGEEIARILPGIESFAEIGDYIDQPVRVYSSGMQVRLAFSVATARRPDVLIVDEALSVGDAYFQHKSFDRIREFRRQGTTLLIVSHDKQAIQSLCDRAILLNGGRIAMQGDPEAVMDFYNALLAKEGERNVRQRVMEDGRVQTVSGTGEVVVEEVALLDEKGERVELVNVGQALQLRIVARAVVDIPELVLGYMIKDRLGQPVFGTNTHHLKRPIGRLGRNESIACSFAFAANLGEGAYSISVALHTADTHLGKNYEWRDLSVLFHVVNVDKSGFIGVAWLPPRVECSR
jgi:lipopolysaccharide transport system ATP-binding protein